MTDPHADAANTIVRIGNRQADNSAMTGNTAQVITNQPSALPPSLLTRIVAKLRRESLKMVRKVTRRIFSYTVSRLAVFAEQHPAWVGMKTDIAMVEVTQIELQSQMDELVSRIALLELTRPSLDTPPKRGTPGTSRREA